MLRQGRQLLVAKPEALPSIDLKKYCIWSRFFYSAVQVYLHIVFCLLRGLKWLKEQLHGSELLEERGRMIFCDVDFLFLGPIQIGVKKCNLLKYDPSPGPPLPTW